MGNGPASSQQAPSRTVVQGSPLRKPRQAFLVSDLLEQVVYASSSLCAILGLAEETVTRGMGLLDLLTLASKSTHDTGRTLNEFLVNEQLVESSAAPGLHVQPFNLLSVHDGRSVEVSFQRFGEHYRAVSFEDVTLELEAEHPLAIVGYRDQLTGLGNRALFEQRLNEALIRLTPGTSQIAIVLFLDLDRFKVVNDTLGHAVGDELLRLVSKRLQSLLGSSDTLARMGGDEFAILLEHCAHEESAAGLAARIIQLIQRTYLIDGHVINVGASMGVAVAPKDGSSGDQLLKSADLALYFSKGAGRGVAHFFQPAMQEKAERRRTLELDLRKALVLRQFELHYQPQIDVKSQSITGLEALLRWRHPLRGLVLPDDFIGVTEEIGLVLPLGEWVLRTACREATSWPASVTVAVNVSPLQFEAGKFTDSVKRALEASGLPGCRLEIEVTEDILQRSGEMLLETLHSLRELGVRVAMDRFGTGLASMSQLVKFPFSKIKIDRTLIGLHQEDDVKSRAIVRAISVLGQSLGIATLAEGVETPEHLEQVQLQGCNSVQGFYYSKAVPADELHKLLASTFPASPSRTATDEVTYEPRSL